MRKLQQIMIDYFDQKLALNGLAQHAIKTKDARTLMIEAAKVCVGIKEKTGKNDGPIVEAMQKTSGGGKGNAWCMYFVQTCIAYAELKTGKKSPLLSSGHCLTVWGKAKAENKVKSHPLPGAIAIWKHGNGPSGHTEIVLGADAAEMKNVGGNTSGKDASGKVTREGNGVYFTTRAMQQFPKIKPSSTMKLVGFLIPF